METSSRNMQNFVCNVSKGVYASFIIAYANLFFVVMAVAKFARPRG